MQFRAQTCPQNVILRAKVPFSLKQHRALFNPGQNTDTSHVYLSFGVYYVFNYDTCRNIGGKHILRIRPNDDMKADSASLFRPAESVHVAFKAAVPTENIETSVTDRSRPYPEFLCCYCIQILLTKPSY